MIEQNIPLLVHHIDGSIQAAILIAIRGGHLRSAIPGEADVTEFQWENGQWKTESGQPVEIQFDMPQEEFSRRALVAVRSEQAFDYQLPAISFQQVQASAASTERPHRWSN